MAEQTFLEEGEVTVTNSRFVVPGQTYAMSGVTSVKSTVYNPSRIGPIILIVLGILGMIIGAKSGALPGGIILLVIGIAWWVLKKPKYSIMLSSASGEVEALTSKNKGFILRVVDAVNEAIIARG